MKIERVTRYSILGKEFESLAKAQDHVDGEVNRLLQSLLMGNSRGFGVTDCIVITEALLTNRKAFATLFSCQLPDEDDEDEYNERY